MQIHCTIATKDREVDIDGTKYLFTANAQGDYVAEVKKAHAAKMLAVPEAFTLYGFDDEDEEPAKTQEPVKTTATDPDAASLEAIERANEAAAAQAIADAKAKAAAEADDFEDDGAGKAEDEDEDEADATPTLEEMLGDPSLITVAIVEAAEDAELEFLFQAAMDRAPHPKAKAPKIRETLIEELKKRAAA